MRFRIAGLMLAAAITNPSQIKFTQNGTGAVQRTLALRLSDLVSVKDFGATGDGTTDDTTAIQNAVNYVCTLGSGDGVNTGAWLFIPPGRYLLNGSGTELIKLPCRIKMTGAGMLNSVFIVKSTVGATVDAMRLVGTAYMDGIVLEDFGIQPQSGTPGRHGLNIDSTSFGIARLYISRLQIGILGGKGIVSTNPTPLADGFFTSDIRQSVIYNGISLQNAGDTIIIEENVIPSGANIGIDVTMIPGAIDLVVFKNNISGCGAAIHFGKGVAHPRLEFNEMEGCLAANTGSNSAYVDIDGLAGFPIQGVVFYANHVNPRTTGIDGLRMNYVDQSFVEGNTFVRVAGAAVDIRTTANMVSGSGFIGINRYEPTTDVQANILADSAISLVQWQFPYAAGTNFNMQLSRYLTVTSLEHPSSAAEVNVPVVSSADTMSVLGTAQTYTGDKRFTSTKNIGSCTLNAASPAVCTATVAAGSKCLAVPTGTTAAAATHTLATSVTTTTLTVTGANGLSDVVNYICF